MLGSAFLVGGYYHIEQKHEKISSQINATLLTLGIMALVFPNALVTSGMTSQLGLIGFSRGISLVLFLIYIGFLVFQLKTHTHLYEDQEVEEDAEEKIPMIAQSSDGGDGAKGNEGTISENRSPEENRVKEMNGNERVQDDKAEQDEDDDEDEDLLGFNYSLVWLAIVTALIAVLSDAISATIQSAALSVGISRIFLSAIILPIVGNAAEHAGAIMFAAKNRLDLTLGTCKSYTV